MSKKLSSSSNSTVKKKSTSKKIKESKRKKEIPDIKNDLNQKLPPKNHKTDTKLDRNSQISDEKTIMYKKQELKTKKRNLIKKHHSSPNLKTTPNIDNFNSTDFKNDKLTSNFDGEPIEDSIIKPKKLKLQRSSTSSKISEIASDNPLNDRKTRSLSKETSKPITKDVNDSTHKEMEQFSSIHERKRKRKVLRKKKEMNAVQFLSNENKIYSEAFHNTNQCQLMEKLKMPVPDFLEFQVPIIDTTGSELNDIEENYSFPTILKRLHNSLLQ